MIKECTSKRVCLEKSTLNKVFVQLLIGFALEIVVEVHFLR